MAKNYIIHNTKNYNKTAVLKKLPNVELWDIETIQNQTENALAI